MILDELQNAARYRPLHPGFAAAFDFLAAGRADSLPDGRHAIDGDRLFVLVNASAGKGRDAARLECHRKYIDIQLTLAGEEEIGVRPTGTCADVDMAYNPDRDLAFFRERPTSWLAVPAGSFAIFYPDDAHAPLACQGNVRKVVVKVAVDWRVSEQFQRSMKIDAATIEPLAAAAWPAALVQPLDGWRLRFNDGVTRRANSVLPLACDGQNPLEHKLTQVEQFYRDRGLPSCYHVGPTAQPAELDDALAERGYALVFRTCTQHASLATVLRKTRLDDHHQLQLIEGFDAGWFATYCEAEQTAAKDIGPRQGIIERIAARKACALTKIAGQPVATGLAVLQGEWLGIFSVATRSDFRRQGAATAALHGLARWGQEQGARHAYLQVLETNRPARSLYRRAGFVTAFHYHYREREELAPVLLAGDLEN